MDQLVGLSHDLFYIAPLAQLIAEYGVFGICVRPDPPSSDVETIIKQTFMGPTFLSFDARVGNIPDVRIVVDFTATERRILYPVFEFSGEPDLANGSFIPANIRDNRLFHLVLRSETSTEYANQKHLVLEHRDIDDRFKRLVFDLHASTSLWLGFNVLENCLIRIQQQ